jgi:hypothetical protein
VVALGSVATAAEGSEVFGGCGAAFGGGLDVVYFEDDGGVGGG